jgi:hypothetical protein
MITVLLSFLSIYLKGYTGNVRAKEPVKTGIINSRNINEIAINRFQARDKYVKKYQKIMKKNTNYR